MKLSSRKPRNLDRTDRLILQFLQEEGRISNVALAKKVNLSATPCMERVRRLGRQADLLLNPPVRQFGMTEVKFPHPLFEGDTVHCTTEVIGKRESKSRKGAGIVEFARDHQRIALDGGMVVLSAQLLQ